MTLAKAAAALGISESGVRSLVKRGELRQLPSVGRAWLVFDPGAVEALRVKREAAKGHPWRGRAVVPKREKGVQ